MIENQTLRVHRGSAILDHVSDASGQSGDLTVQGRPRCQSRPLSMIEMRDTGQSVMPAVWIGGQPAVFLCVHPLLSHAWYVATVSSMCTADGGVKVLLLSMLV